MKSVQVAAPIVDSLAFAWEFFDIPRDKAHQRSMPIEIDNLGRTHLARFFKAAGFKVGAEIGVETGEYSLVLLKANTDLRLHCVDAWKAYRGYREHVSQAKVDDLFAQAQRKLASYDAIFHRQFSVDAAQHFPDGFLDFVYIDANHTLPHVIADLNAWVPKVRAGGVIAGHDYCKRKSNGYQVHVVEAVQAWTQAYHIAPWFILGSKEVKDGETRDRPRSWFWVKA